MSYFRFDSYIYVYERIGPKWFDLDSVHSSSNHSFSQKVIVSIVNTGGSVTLIRMLLLLLVLLLSPFRVNRRRENSVKCLTHEFENSTKNWYACVVYQWFKSKEHQFFFFIYIFLCYLNRSALHIKCLLLWNVMRTSRNWMCALCRNKFLSIMLSKENSRVIRHYIIILRLPTANFRLYCVSFFK